MIRRYSALRGGAVASLLAALALSSAGPASVRAQRPARTAEAVHSRPTPNTLSAGERAEVFEEVWETINKKYYDPAFNGVDWKAVRESYRPRLAAVSTDEEFYGLLNRMAGELRDAHTRVRSPRQNRDRKRRQATSAGVLVYEVENTPVIFDVAPDSEAARAGVLPGMSVRTVDGRPTGEALAEVRRELGASSSERATRVLSYLRLIAGEPGTLLKLGLTRADGTPFEVALPRRTVSAAPQFAARLLPSGYAYIRFDRFRSPVGRLLKESLVKFRGTPGLILDLRANGGGDGREGLRAAGYFFNDEVPVARIVTRTGRPPSALFGLVSLPKEFRAGEKGGQIYPHPVVIVVNEGTASTSELIASAMQEHGRAYIVGTQSCGCVLGVLDHRELKGGGALAVSELGFVSSKGRRLEGNGVTPDEPVTVTLRDLRRGRDAALEGAETYLDGLLGGRR